MSTICNKIALLLSLCLWLGEIPLSCANVAQTLDLYLSQKEGASKKVLKSVVGWQKVVRKIKKAVPLRYNCSILEHIEVEIEVEIELETECLKTKRAFFSKLVVLTKPYASFLPYIILYRAWFTPSLLHYLPHRLYILFHSLKIP